MKHVILVATLIAMLVPCAFAQTTPSQAVTKSGTDSTTRQTTQSQSIQNSVETSRSASRQQSSQFSMDASYSLVQIAVSLACWKRNDPQGFATWSKAAQNVASQELPGAANYIDQHLMPYASSSEQLAATLFWALWQHQDSVITDSTPSVPVAESGLAANNLVKQAWEHVAGALAVSCASNRSRP